LDAFSSIRDLLGHLLPPAAEEEASPPAHVASGIEPLDAETGGWRRGEVAVVGGEAGVGKSAFVYGAALHAAVELRVAVALVPLKHAVPTCVGRLVCARAGVSILRFRRSAVDAAERERLARAAEALEGAPLFIHAAADLALADLADHVRRASRTRGVGLVAIDGLPALHLGGAHATRGERVGGLTAGLAALAAELGVAILASVDAPVLPMAAAAAHLTLALERTPGAARLRLPTGRVVPLRFDVEALRFGG